MLRKLRQFKNFLEKIADKLNIFSATEQALIEALSRQKNADAALKLRVYYLLKDLQKIHRQSFGMIIVLGWDDKWLDNYASILDSDQNLFSARNFDIKSAADEEVLKTLGKTADFDGAIFMTKEGVITASGMYLENMKPKELSKVLNSQKSGDLSSVFGFVKKVHTRHLTAIAASYWLKDATVYVVSEEDDSLRVFEGGKIVWSTVSGEALTLS